MDGEIVLDRGGDSVMKLDDNEQILLVDYCVFNRLYRCFNKYINYCS